MTSVRGEVRFSPSSAGQRLCPSVVRTPEGSGGIVPPAIPSIHVTYQSCIPPASRHQRHHRATVRRSASDTSSDTLATLLWHTHRRVCNAVPGGPGNRGWQQRAVDERLHSIATLPVGGFAAAQWPVAAVIERPSVVRHEKQHAPLWTDSRI